jgi:hypothetical protein
VGVCRIAIGEINGARTNCVRGDRTGPDCACIARNHCAAPRTPEDAARAGGTALERRRD